MKLFHRSVLLNRWNLVDRYPYRSMLFVLISLLIPLTIISLLLKLVTRNIHVPLLERLFLGEPVLALIVALLISFFGWRWSGFNGITRQEVKVCLGAMPLIIVSLLALPLVAGKASVSVIVIALVTALLAGFVEEGLFRGLMLRILLPKGIWHSIILTSLLFASAHLINLAHGFSWLYIVGQMMVGLGSGILFATVRLRTGSVWPTVLLHAAYDVSGLILIGVDPQRINSLS